jgi:kynureninase
MHQNVAVAEAVVLSCFLPADARRNRVVYERENFPSVRYLYQAQPELDVVVCEDDRAIVDAIDERTLLVPISHVLFKTAEIQDVEPIVRRAHEVGAHVILDCYQSAGIVPVDVAALGVDFAVGGSVKWLCGGPGNGWLYVRPDLAERLTPTVTGWQAHEAPFGFEEEMRYASGAARFLTGTPNVPAHFAGTAGYDLIEEVGVERIRANSLRQTQLLIDLADEAGFEVRSRASPSVAAGRSPSTSPTSRRPPRAAEREILCDFRPDAGIRLGPHFYTSDDELRFVVEQIGEILETGAHRRHLGRRGAALAGAGPHPSGGGDAGSGRTVDAARAAPRSGRTPRPEGPCAVSSLATTLVPRGPRGRRPGRRGHGLRLASCLRGNWVASQGETRRVLAALVPAAFTSVGQLYMTFNRGAFQYGRPG